MSVKYAPGWPGLPPRWTAGCKSGVGAALNQASHAWFTLGHGILNEIYYPRVDLASVRDMGLIVTDGVNYFSEEKRDTLHFLQWLADGIPAFEVVNSCKQGHYRLRKVVLTDPYRHVVLQQTRLEPLEGELENYHLYVLLALDVTEPRERDLFRVSAAVLRIHEAKDFPWEGANYSVELVEEEQHLPRVALRYLQRVRS